MDGMGHGGFARGQTKDLRKGLKTREGRAKLTSFKQLPAPLLTPFSQTQVCPACASHVSHPIHFAWGGLVSSFSRHRRENIVLVKDHNKNTPDHVICESWGIFHYVPNQLYFTLY